MIQKFVERIYPHLPIVIQNALISAYGYLWFKRRFGGKFKAYYNAFKGREFFSHEEWLGYINNELSKLLVHAYSNVPYYRELYSSMNLSTDLLSEFKVSDLPKLPFLEKDMLRTYGDNKLISINKQSKGEFFSSSGSTGKPTKILFSANMHQKWSAAFESRIRNWAGVSNMDGRGMIGGRRVVKDANSNSPFYRYNFIEKQIYFSAYHINYFNTSNYVFAINKYKPIYMTGYAMSNYFLARFIEESNLKVQPLKAVITSSEKLTPEMRETFKRVYNCKTYDSYSGVEACGLISECEFGKLHVSEDVGYIEFIKEDGTHAKPGEIGEMICTGFLNYDQPLIRYRIGDMAKWSLNQTCNCKRNMPIIEEITGRVEDTVVGQDGRRMVRFHGIFVDIPSIIEGQIIQHDLNEFEIKIVGSAALTTLEKKIITQRLESQIGKIVLTINMVDSIPRNNNGKFKAVISKIK